IGRSYGIPTVALRFFNVYGSRQALSNPYTGVAAIFSARALNSRPPLLYEDGAQRRDLVHVSDVVQAILLVVESEAAAYRVFNVGTGRSLSIREIAQIICDRIGRPGLAPEVVAGHRKGDIRHCFPDISALRALGYAPRVRFEQGVAELVEWVRAQSYEDLTDRATAELRSRGLVS
ncbi:MAG TPA: NAD-dependent epimerase/dehydratase family protein, partial [Chloroflexota bacterium]